MDPRGSAPRGVYKPSGTNHQYSFFPDDDLLHGRLKYSRELSENPKYGFRRVSLVLIFLIVLFSYYILTIFYKSSKLFSQYSWLLRFHSEKDNVTATLLRTLVRKLERKNVHQGEIINSQADQTISTELLRQTVIDNHRLFEASKEMVMDLESEKNEWQEEMESVNRAKLRLKEDTLEIARLLQQLANVSQQNEEMEKEIVKLNFIQKVLETKNDLYIGCCQTAHRFLADERKTVLD